MGVRESKLTFTAWAVVGDPRSPAAASMAQTLDHDLNLRKSERGKGRETDMPDLSDEDGLQWSKFRISKHTRLLGGVRASAA